MKEHRTELSRSPAQNTLCGLCHPLCSQGLSFFNCCVKGWGERPNIALARAPEVGVTAMGFLLVLGTPD